jgi:hypothetical protein
LTSLHQFIINSAVDNAAIKRLSDLARANLAWRVRTMGRWGFTKQRFTPLYFDAGSALVFDSEHFHQDFDGVFSLASEGGDRSKFHNILCNTCFCCCHSAGLALELGKFSFVCHLSRQGSADENDIKHEDAKWPEGRCPTDAYVPRRRAGTPLDFVVASGLNTTSLFT